MQLDTTFPCALLAPSGYMSNGTTPRAHGDICNGRGQVQGLENLFVVDASLMPVITACNTNIPTALIGWRVARVVRDFLDDRPDRSR